MKKKHLIIMGVIILGVLAILGLYQTFALSGDITKDTSGYYNVTVLDGTSVNVPANSSKTVYYKLTNTNKGTVQYGVGYSGNSIIVKYYSDTQDLVTGIVDYGKSKFIKLYIVNSGDTASSVELSTILGYEKGGDLIVPSGVTLVSEEIKVYQGLAKLIANDTFTANSTVSNNGINYEYDTTNNLMKDIGDNIRYYGASPNNYIYFNCSDYANQSSSTCETWRIIGVFDGKVKLMRDSHIGGFSWDNKDTSTGAETNDGKNDWTDARLMKLLNPGYESETIGGSLYYDAKSGNCYKGKNNATTACDFTTIGIKNAATRNIISDTTYYLGGYDADGCFSEFSNNAYTYERGTKVYNERPITWTGKISLPYPSDYGYAVDFSKCQQQLGNYYNTSCTANNWMNNIITNNGENISAFISPSAKNPGQILIATVASVFNCSVFNTTTYFYYIVIPVLYLDPSVDIKLGLGTSSVPYQLDV